MRKTNLLALTLLLGTGTLVRASQIVYVTVDTTSLNATTGSVDFQFNPGPLVSQAATVQIGGFSGVTYAGGQQDFGGASGGPIPAAVNIANSAQDNEDFESVTFTKSLSFSLTFDGPAVTSPNGTSTSTSLFALSLFSDAAGTKPVLTSDPNGIAATVTVNLDGTLSRNAISPNVQLTGVPEPGSLPLLAGALAMLGALRFSKRRS